MASVTPQKKYQQLLQLLAHRDRAVARNNALARQNSAFAARLAASRASSQLDAQVAQAVMKAHVAMRQQNGMGYAGIIAGGVAAVVLSVLAIAGTYVFYQIWREERDWAAANPVQASIESGTKAVWAVFAIGLVALGGLVYWDYRKNRPVYSSYSGGLPPFEPRPGLAPRTRQTDMSTKALGKDVQRLEAEARLLGAEAKSALPSMGRTKVDPSIEARMEEEREIWEAAHQAELADRRGALNYRGFGR